MKTLNLLYLISIFLIFSCKKENNITIQRPEDRGDGISVGIAADAGFDASLLFEMKELNQNGTFENVHSILIAKDNQLVFEEYFEAEKIISIQSVTKSFTSALVGIAVDKYGLTTNENIQGYFSEAGIDASNWQGGKELITVENLLTMSGGFPWNETQVPYSNPTNDHLLLYESNNWLKFILERPLTSEPGSMFNYNSGLSIALGEIVSQISGMTVANYTEKYLFSPMGITKSFWSSADPTGTYQTGGGLHLIPRDMLKFGMLYLNEGVWGNEQLITKDWVNLSTSQQGPGSNYAYQWWLDNYNVGGKNYKAFFAWGNLGQFIIVVKELQLVVVFTGNIADNELARNQTRKMIIDYIIPTL